MGRVESDRGLLLNGVIADLTSEIKTMECEVVRRACTVLNEEVSLLSLNARIGGKGNTYVDSIRTQFYDFEDYLAQWINGLNKAFVSERALYYENGISFNWDDRAAFRNVKLLQDEFIFSYAKKFLERIFYKSINEKTRSKPNESLWQIWFGDKLTYGLLIAPRYLSDRWLIDRSEIRKADYRYWTVGHVMKTGLVIPSVQRPTSFNSLADLYSFYETIIKRLSKSVYEQEIYDRYINYLKVSAKPEEEPFLIPEFRYAGFQKFHEYRLDLTVLNTHSREFVGFEISPASSHMNVKKLKDKQVVVNNELKLKWENEMEKRNRYYDAYGITSKTFTDTALLDIDLCFEQIKAVLSNRPEEKLTIKSQTARLNAFR